MSKSAGTTKTVSSSGPAGFQQPYIDQMLSEAQRLYGTAGPQFFPGSTVAGFTGPETAAGNYLQKTAGDMANYVTTDLLPAFKTGLTAYDVTKNPTVAAAAQGAMQPVFQQLTQQVLPQIRNQAVGVGGYGGSRQGIAEGIATGQAARSAQDITAQMYNQAYLGGLDTLSRTISQIPTLQQAQTMPGTVLSAVGAQQRQLDQARINEEIARHNWGQMLPYQKLTEYANLVKGPYGGTGTSEVMATGGGGVEQSIGGLLGLIGLFPQLWDIFT